MISSIKKILYISLSVILLVSVGIGAYWWYGMKNIKPQMGRLNITEISDDNRLKVVQQNIDFLIDLADSKGGKFIAIIPYVVQAGFDLNKAMVTVTYDDEQAKSLSQARAKEDFIEKMKRFVKQEEKTTSKPVSIAINMPEPEILSVDTADDVPICVLRDKESSGLHDQTKGFKIFGEDFARRTALSRNILDQAVKEATGLLNTFVKNIYPDGPVPVIDIPSVERHEQISYLKCSNLAISFALSSREAENWNIEFNDGQYNESSLFIHSGFTGGLKNAQVRFRLTRAGRATNLDDYMTEWKAPGISHSRFFSSMQPEFRVYLTPLSDNKMTASCILGGFFYDLEFWGADRDTLLNNLPKMLPLVLSLKENPEPVFSSPEIDDFGMTRKLWASATIQQKRSYLRDICSFFERHCPDFKVTTFSDGVPILYDKTETPGDGSLFQHVSRAVKGMFTDPKYSGKYSNPKDFYADCLAILASEPGWGRRDRFIFFMDDSAIFYVPKRDTSGTAIGSAISSLM
ncbi:MAG: DUF4230 domain-containing protein [Ruminiclostridium sp.]|nr:DUF4230 domain-containing protein [Ruminiclostridium sp.]